MKFLFFICSFIMSTSAYSLAVYKEKELGKGMYKQCFSITVGENAHVALNHLQSTQSEMMTKYNVYHTESYFVPTEVYQDEVTDKIKSEPYKNENGQYIVMNRFQGQLSSCFYYKKEKRFYIKKDNLLDKFIKIFS